VGRKKKKKTKSPSFQARFLWKLFEFLLLDVIVDSKDEIVLMNVLIQLQPKAPQIFQ